MTSTTMDQKAPTAERIASQSLMEEGRAALDEGRYEQASDKLQEAIALDPSNGESYYYLASVRLRTGEYGEVSGLLEKAEQLLPMDSDWKAKLEDLRAELSSHISSSGTW